MNDKNSGLSRLQQSLQALKTHFERQTDPQATPTAREASIREAIDALTSATQDLEEKRENLRAAESRLEVIRAESPSNVIPFRRSVSVRSLPSLAMIHTRRRVLRLDCLIESPHISEIHKMARELHDQSQRYAFVEFRDVDLPARRDSQILLSMGAINLFVPSLLDLTLAEQSALLHVVNQDSVNRPLLMVGTTLSYAELRGEPGVNLELLAVLSRAYIKLTKPFSEYKDQGLIDYFLDSLSENPT